MYYYDLAVILYVLSFLCLLITFNFNKRFLQILQILLTIAAVLCNLPVTTDFYQYYSIQNMLMLAACSLGIIYLFINIKYKRTFIGFFILPVIILTGMLALFTSSSSAQSTVPENLWLWLHIPLAVTGISFFTVSFAAGVMYFLLGRQLKKKQFGKIFSKFPPLGTIASIIDSAAFLGFVFYTAALIAATGWLRFHISNISYNDKAFILKIAASVGAWLIFAVLTFLRIRKTPGAKHTIAASTAGFISVLLIYAGVFAFALR